MHFVESPKNKSAELLLEISGLTPGPQPAVFRARISHPSEPLTLDTTPPLVHGSPTEWLVDDRAGSVCGVLMRGAGTTTILMREGVAARHGGARWVATCERLGLPSPPVDPSAPPVFSEWREVAAWKDGAQACTARNLG